MRFERLIEVRHYDVAQWRFAIGHPRSGEISRVEVYEIVGRRQQYVYDHDQKRVRVG